MVEWFVVAVFVFVVVVVATLCFSKVSFVMVK